VLDNDAVGDQAADTLDLLRDQLAHVAAMQKEHAALRLNGAAADGTVEVTVDARGHLVKTVIDKSYLDDHDFEDLGNHITEAARAAVQDAGQRVAEMLAPIGERQRLFPSFSDIVDGVPELKDLMPPGFEGFGADQQPHDGLPDSSADGVYDDGDETGVPTVRR
jgi:DNA-binding protein YbaB